MATFLAKILPRKVAKVLTLQFSRFSCWLKLKKKKNHSPCRKKKIFEEQKKTTKNNKKEVAKLLTYGGQVIDPTAYIYIYISLSLSLSLSPLPSLSVVFVAAAARSPRIHCTSAFRQFESADLLVSNHVCSASMSIIIVVF